MTDKPDSSNQEENKNKAEKKSISNRINNFIHFLKYRLTEEIKYDKKSIQYELRGERIQKILLDINKNYPELQLREGAQETPIIEKIKTYHQLKQIEFQKMQSAAIIILTILNIFIVFYSSIISSNYYAASIALQEPLFTYVTGSCPDNIFDSLYYSFAFRNIGKSTGSIKATIVENESASYEIDPKNGLSVLPTDPAYFNLNIRPFYNSQNFSFTIRATTNYGGCFIKTCSYSQTSLNYYKKAAEDMWLGC